MTRPYEDTKIGDASFEQLLAEVIERAREMRDTSIETGGGKVRFKPRAEPTVISAKPLPARGERPAAADTAKPKGKPPARAGKPGPRPQGRPGAKPPGKPGGKPFGGGPPRGRR